MTIIPQTRPSPARLALVGAAAGLAVIAAIVVGLAARSGTHTAVVLLLAASAGALVAAIALTRFSAYVLLMLGIRSCVDIFKLSGHSAGTAGANDNARATDPSTLLAVLFLICAGLWLAARCYDRSIRRPSPLGVALGAVTATAAVSALGSHSPTDSGMEVLRILTVVVMFVVLEQLIPDTRAARRVLLAGYVSLVLALGYTIVMWALGSPPSEVKGSFVRISGPFSQSTTFGRYLMFMVIFGFGIYRFLSPRWRIALGALLSTSLVFLVLTNTRGALIGAAVGVVIVAILHRSGRLLVTLGLASVLALALAPAVADRFAQLSASRDVGGDPNGNTLAWRMAYWSQIATLANDNPWTGIGPNTTQHETDEAKKPHNDFLRAYVETGVLGLLAYLAMILLFLQTAALALRRAARNTLDRGIAVGFTGCAVSFALVSAASNVISNVVTLWYFVAFAAAAAMVARRPAIEES